MTASIDSPLDDDEDAIQAGLEAFPAANKRASWWSP